ncbi:MAG: universal stress protein [Acidimicrobiales bacterium]|nr:universal stress protein [Acidimicrobiales bacterium]
MGRTTKTSAPTLVGGRVIDEIVAPVSFGRIDDRFLWVAIRLAMRWDIPVHLVNVSDSIDASDPQLDGMAEELKRRHAELKVRRTHVYGHDVATGIASVVQAHSLLVMATDHADEWKVKGSVAEKTLFHAGVPLLLFGPNAADPDLEGDVVIGLDGSLSAEAALEPAIGLATALGVQLWLVQVVDTVSEGDEIDTDIVTYIQDQAAMVEGPPVHGWELIHSNDPVTALEAFAEARGASWLVAGARGRTDPYRRTMGSITMGLVSTAARPVLTLAVSEPDL